MKKRGIIWVQKSWIFWTCADINWRISLYKLCISRVFQNLDIIDEEDTFNFSQITSNQILICLIYRVWCRSPSLLQSNINRQILISASPISYMVNRTKFIVTLVYNKVVTDRNMQWQLLLQVTGFARPSTRPLSHTLTLQTSYSARWDTCLRPGDQQLVFGTSLRVVVRLFVSNNDR